MNKKISIFVFFISTILFSVILSQKVFSQASFSAKTDFTAGNSPTSINSADFNGDGKLDIAVVNRLSTTFSVLLNTTTTGSATPSFSAATNFTTGSGPQAIAVGDINGDGKPDIAVNNNSAGTVSVFLNTTTTGAATPTFTVKTDFTAGTSSSSVSLGDLNGDGKPDLVTSNFFLNTISVLINTTTPGSSTPTFGAKTEFSVPSSNFSIIADVNQDGKKDVLATGGDLFVYLNTTTPGASTPTFAPSVSFTTGTSPMELLVRDFNGDGKPDVANVNFSSTTVSVFFNTTTLGGATPAFTAKTDFTAGNTPYTVTIGDINGDGKPDMATANSTTNNASVFLNTTTPGSLTPTYSAKTDFTTANDPEYLAMGDFNGDGKLDLATANYSSTNMSVLMNTTTPGASTPTFSAKTDFATGSSPACVVVGDINGDGKVDMVTGNNTANTQSVLLNTTTPGASTPTFSAKTDIPGGGSSFSVELGDINGDGKPDMAVTNNGTTTVSVMLNTTTPGASTPTFGTRTDFTVGSGPSLVAIADLNGDGKRDLAIANANSNNVSVLLSTVVLPVELASFTSSVNGNNVVLNWNTVMEENNSGFEIERNSFGAGWNKIGFIAGKGTTNTQQNYSFTDNALNTGRYSYRLKQIDYNGNYKYYELQNEVVIGVPDKFALMQNYPNPFNPVSIINYQLAINSFVLLKVYDLTGKEVASLVNEVKDAGYYSVTFDAKNLSSGTYFYKLSTDKFSDVKKMVIIK